MYALYRSSVSMSSTLMKGRTTFISMISRLFSSASRNNRDNIKPRRAILYVPGNDRRKIDKVRTVNVDCAVLDCEDGVAMSMKSEARNLISTIDENFDFGRSEYAVRINSIDSGLADEDLRSILTSKRLPDTIMIPKVEDVNHVVWIDEKIKSYLKSSSNNRKLSLVIFIESAKSFLNLQKICESAVNLLNNKMCSIEGLVFGSDDFCADIGATRSTEGLELLAARQIFVIVAKCFRLQAIDMVHINYKDIDGLSKISTEGAKMGFTGKQVIHPNQVPIVQKAFSPSEEKIKWATDLIRQFELHQKEGRGAFTFQGAMIDKPLLLQAQNIINIAKIIS